VDFEAAYDGPVIPGAVNTPVDDLIICEACLLEAFQILDPQGLHESLEKERQLVKAHEEASVAKDKIIQGLRSSINELAQHPVKSFPGKPKLEGVSDEVRTEMTKARYSRAKEKAAR
jgi:hypothetical protein